MSEEFWVLERDNPPLVENSVEEGPYEWYESSVDFDEKSLKGSQGLGGTEGLVCSFSETDGDLLGFLDPSFVSSTALFCDLGSFVVLIGPEDQEEEEDDVVVDDSERWVRCCEEMEDTEKLDLTRGEVVCVVGRTGNL